MAHELSPSFGLLGLLSGREKNDRKYSTTTITEIRRMDPNLALRPIWPS